MMSQETAGAVFRELDVCRSLFDSLAYQLENNSGLGDYHGLSVLAAEGMRKVDAVVDMIDRRQIAGA